MCCLLLPMAPGICLLDKRLLYFLWRVFKLLTARLGSAVTSADSWAAGVANDFESVLSVCPTKIKFSELVVSLLSAGLVDEVSLCSTSPVPPSSRIFSISSVRAARRDHCCGESWEGCWGWLGVPGEEWGDGASLWGSSWRLMVSRCKTGGAALASTLERRVVITAWNCPPSWCSEESSV